MGSSNDPVAIIGAGYLGRSVAAALDGPVVAVNRGGRWGDDGPRPSHVSMASIDLMDVAADVSALRECTRAVFCVAPGRTQDRRGLYVDATRQLLERWPTALRRVVWVGSTSALPNIDGWLDERCTERPQGDRGGVQRDAEDGVMEFAKHRGIPWWVLRLGGLYGPGRELDRIYATRGKGPRPGDGMAPTNLIHRHDATAAVLAALTAPADPHGLVHVVDDDHTPRRQMYARIADARGEAPITWAEDVPAGAVPKGKRVSNRRMKQWLGVRLRVPLHRLD